MKELRVRAYDSATGKVSEPFDVKESWGDYLIDFGDYSTDGALDSIIWEPATGLTDKNGKEIYGGDIVNATIRISAPHKDDTFRNVRGKIIYGPGGAFHIEEPGVFTSNDEGAERKFTVINPLFNVTSLAGVEVIGNIHENPELLGGK